MLVSVSVVLDVHEYSNRDISMINPQVTSTFVFYPHICRAEDILFNGLLLWWLAPVSLMWSVLLFIIITLFCNINVRVCYFSHHSARRWRCCNSCRRDVIPVLPVSTVVPRLVATREHIHGQQRHRSSTDCLTKTQVWAGACMRVT